jgi:hypothetical protein
MAAALRQVNRRKETELPAPSARWLRAMDVT